MLWRPSSRTSSAVWQREFHLDSLGRSDPERRQHAAGRILPHQILGATTVNWPGYLYEYWFYNSQSFSNIREDTVHDYILELNQDYGISFDFDPQLGLSVNRYSDPAASGNPSTFVDNVRSGFPYPHMGSREAAVPDNRSRQANLHSGERRQRRPDPGQFRHFQYHPHRANVFSAGHALDIRSLPPGIEQYA